MHTIVPAKFAQILMKIFVLSTHFFLNDLLTSISNKWVSIHGIYSFFQICYWYTKGTFKIVDLHVNVTHRLEEEIQQWIWTPLHV